MRPLADAPFTAASLEDLLAPQQAWLNRLRLCYGTERDRFDHEVLRLIEGYAAYVHLLPATPEAEFQRPGGLLQLGVETAFYSLQGSDAQIFSGRASLTARRHLEHRWRLATLIAGLCAETYRAVGQLQVITPSGQRWLAITGPLMSWLAQHNVDHYAVRWWPERHEQRALTLFALPHLIPPDLMHYLAEDNEVIIPHLLASLAGVPISGEPSVIEMLVRRAQALVIDRERAAYSGCHGVHLPAPHLKRPLQEALRQLCQRNPAWQPNGNKSRYWWGADGAFLIWPDAATELYRQLKALIIPGLPAHAGELLPLLIAAHLLQLTPQNSPLWTLQPPGAKTPVTAIKLDPTLSIATSLEPQPVPLSQNLVLSDSEPKA